MKDAGGLIVVFGTVARDRVVRLAAPLRPGGKQAGEDRGERLGGGAAIAAAALARAGHRVRVAAAVGDDGEAGRLAAELARAGVDTSLLRPAPGPSPSALILTDPDGERTVVRSGKLPYPTADPGFLSACRKCSCLYVRGHAPGIEAVMQEVSPDTLVVAHVPPCDAGALPAHLLVGSASDLDAAFLADPVAAGRRVAGARLRWVVVTRGARGAEAFSADGVRLAVPAAQVAAVDTTGAGDVFAAGLIHGVLAGWPLERALLCAVAWGTASVLREGSLPGPRFPPPDPPGEAAAPP
jgi:sugar/nucleoside kinase (ribokinase family)